MIIRRNGRVRKLENVDKCCASHPYLALQSLVVLPIVLWEQLEFLTNISEIKNNFRPTKTRTRNSCL